MERLEVLGLKDSKDEMPGVVVDNDDGDGGGEVVVGDSRSTGGHGRRSKAGSCEGREEEAAGGTGEGGEGRPEGGGGRAGGAGGGGGMPGEAEVEGGDWTRSPCPWSASLSVWP